MYSISIQMHKLLGCYSKASNTFPAIDLARLAFTLCELLFAHLAGINLAIFDMI